jgi:hypothetical protein
MDLLSPWNLVFLLPAVGALLYLLLLATGAVSAELGDVDVEVDLDADADVDHGVEHVVGDASGHGDDAAHAGGLSSALEVLGVGRIPLSLLLMTFCFLWGFLGWLGNLVFGGLIGNEAVAFLPSLALALVGATFLTRTFAVLLGRIVPATESYGVTYRELVGSLATVRYAVTDQAGTAQLHNERGVLIEVPVRVRPGEAPIASGREVVLWNYDPEDNVFLVTHDPDLDRTPGETTIRLIGNR